MTKSFDEWYFKQRYLGIEPIDHARAAFKAGAQSKQAEIDELREMVRRLVDNTIVAVDDALENQANDLLKGDQS